MAGIVLCPCFIVALRGIAWLSFRQTNVTVADVDYLFV